MAKERREEEVCLPSDFLCDDHFLEEKRRRDDCFLEEFAMNLDWPAENECLCMTGLAWQTPGSFLGDTKYCDGRYGFTAGSHGTALRGRFISEKKGSLDAPSLVALPPALSFSDHCETANSGHCTSPVPIHLQRFQATQQQQPQPGSGMRAVFLSSPSARRESAGTGVFLPRIGGDTSEPPKKPGTDLFSFVLPRRIFGCLSVLSYALLLL
ncbi:unnamed protein product [Musa acuminata var. zebrina]